MNRLLTVLGVVAAVVAAAVVAYSVVGLLSTETPSSTSAPTDDPTPVVLPTPSPAPTLSAKPSRSTSPEPARTTRRPAQPLKGLTIALDPGHQLGKGRFPQTNALVPAGGFDKPCNTTGTATDTGIPEATVNFELAEQVRRRLEALGARVAMTRTTNSAQEWGPCIDARGEFGARVGARLMVSLHADGSTQPRANGFHVIAPTSRAPWTDDIAGPSLDLARALRDGLDDQGIPRANYGVADAGLIQRDDLGTLNLSDVPVAMVEIGNMRSPGDAQRMTSTAGQALYADAVVRGIRTFLDR